MSSIEAPADDRRLLAALHGPGGPRLCLLIARRHRLDAKGRCLPGEPLALVEEPQGEEALPALLARDSDLYPCKDRCDIVVAGHAWNPGQERGFGCGIRLGSAGAVLRVHGERRVQRHGDGSLSFSDAEPLEKIPLHAGSAYGGADLAAEAHLGNPLAPVVTHLDPAQQAGFAALPFHASPRNPVGRGWLIDPTDAALAALRLPYLEDPEQPLDPGTLALGWQGLWPRTPLPAHLGWVDHGSFPRCLHFGVLPWHDPEVIPAQWREVQHGSLVADAIRPGGAGELRPGWDQGAVHSLQSALRGDESGVLYHLKRGLAEWRFRLPGERPRARIARPDGKMEKAEAILQTVLVRPDQDCIDLTWSCRVPARRGYTPEDLAQVVVELDSG